SHRHAAAPSRKASEPPRNVRTRNVAPSGRQGVRTLDRKAGALRCDAAGREGGAPMKARASCFGAGTIVNAIAAGRGVAFGLALRASATVERRPDAFGLRVDVADGVDPALALGAARMMLHRSGVGAGLAISIDSEIPISRGLKSSSAVANAVVLASARALRVELEPLEMIRIGVRAAIEAGVTITG